MNKLTILTFNNFDQYFWKTNTGYKSSINIQKFSNSSINRVLENDAKIILIDFYFSRITLVEEQRICSNIINEINHFGKRINLFFLSASYAGEPMMCYQNQFCHIKGHNFSIHLFKALHSVLNKSISFQKAK